MDYKRVYNDLINSRVSLKEERETLKKKGQRQIGIDSVSKLVYKYWDIINK